MYLGFHLIYTQNKNPYTIKTVVEATAGVDILMPYINTGKSFHFKNILNRTCLTYQVMNLRT